MFAQPRIQKIYPHQYQEEIIVLLARHFPDPATHWKKFFVARHWPSLAEGLLGFALICDERVVGFLGIIVSQHQRATGETITVCNQSCWAVDKSYRHYSLLLMHEVLCLPGVAVWTSTTNSVPSMPMLYRFGYKVFADKRTLVLPVPALMRNVQIHVITDSLVDMLTGAEKQVYDAHKNLCCAQVLIRDDHQRCFCILVKGRVKRIFPVAKCYYVSNAHWLPVVLPAVRFSLCRKLRVGWLFFEGELFTRKNFWAWTIRLALPRVFKSDSVTADEVTLLYSEFMLFGL